MRNNTNILTQKKTKRHIDWDNVMTLCFYAILIYTFFRGMLWMVGIDL